MAGLTKSEFLRLRETTAIENEFAEPYVGAKRNLHFIEIDGYRIGGYSTYSFYIQKTYSKEPTRSSSGVIDNLDSYVTFLTPTVKIKFNALSATQYRTIVRLMHERNEHLIRCYDAVYDTTRAFNAYFAPDDYPELFVLDFEMLGVLNYEIELIGTNTDVNTYSITYHINDPNEALETTIGTPNYPFGQEVIVGKNSISAQKIGGYRFAGWNNSPDGTGNFQYPDGAVIKIQSDMILYAIWEDTSTYTLSYNYGIGKIAKDKETNKDIISIDIAKGSPISYTPTEANKVTFLEEEYYPYEQDPKWYWTPQPTLDLDGEYNSKAVQNGDLYEIEGNATLYQIFKPLTFTVEFYADEEGIILMSTSTGEYGAALATPNFPDGTNKWKIIKVDGEVYSGKEAFLSNKTIPPVNISLAAVKK